MFKKMRMKNFKSWADTGDVRLAPLTAFFGTNSSGKSSLLQMLLLLKQTTESNDRNLVLKTSGYVELGTPDEIVHANTDTIEFALQWQFPQSPSGATLDKLDVLIPSSGKKLTLQELDFATTIHVEGAAHVKSIRYGYQDSFSVRFERGANNQYAIRVAVNGEEPNRPAGRPRVVMNPQKSYGFSDEALRYYADTQYLADMVLLFEQQFRQVYYLGPLRDYPQRIYKYGGEKPDGVGLRGTEAVNALISATQQEMSPYPPKRGRRSDIQTSIEKRVEQWLKDLDLARSFNIRQLGKGRSEYEIRMRRHDKSREVVITDMGIGVSQILPVLVLCYYAPIGSTVILEQPELHLHPAVQSGLADVLIDAIENRGIQIILESHSEHLLRRLQRRISEKKIKADNTALYFCDIEHGVSKLQALEMDAVGNIRNWPPKFFGDIAEDVVTLLDNSFSD